MEFENTDINEMQTIRTPIEITDCFRMENDCKISDEKCFKKMSMLNMLSGFYAEFAVVLATVSVFIEAMHGPVPLFNIHVYFYFYLLGMSILIFVTICHIELTQKSNKANENIELEMCKFTSILNLTRYFQLVLIVCGFTVLFFTCLGCITILAAPSRCLNATSIIYFMIHFVFIVLQLSFFFTNSKTLWRKIHALHKFFVYHLIATNVALLFHAMIWESSKAWQDAIHFKYNSSVKSVPADVKIVLHSLKYGNWSANHGVQTPKHQIHMTANCWWRQENETFEDISSLQLCLQNSSVGMLWSQTAQYVYPVIVQYYIIVAFVIFILWDSKNQNNKDQNVTSQINQNTLYSFILSKGFFFGIIVFVASIIFVILKEIINLNFLSIMIMSCSVLILASVCTLLGLHYIKYAVKSRRFFNQNFVLFVQRCGMYFIYCWCAICHFVTLLSGEKLSFILLLQSLLMIFHAVIQFIFIHQICSISFQSFRVKSLKPILIFLTLSNISLWILECFVLWNNDNLDIQLRIYGRIFWSIFKRLVLPCIAFYRLYSSVILTHIWKILLYNSKLVTYG